AWSPGLNMPFDPIASRKAQELNLQVIIAGKNLKNLKNILEDKKFKGTVIS
ncbi:MAG: UMP kinase, partial [Patescibacteria group bacterium]|nr:UMP kinase [Patescibacteria group bacterium]